MLSRPLITIWRYTAVDLWRLILLTASTLVAVIGFALTIKFFADGALGPLQTLAFMAFAAIPMLQYALPFAGGFAATLVYHRLSQDNELTGARAGGISYAAILAPAAVTGIFLALTLSLLSELIIPRMLLSMEQMVTASVAKIITSSISQSRQIEAGRLRVYADDVQPHPSNPNELVMSGVVVLRVDGDGSVLGSAVARVAQVSLVAAKELDEERRLGRGATIVQLRLHDATADAGSGVFAQSGLIEYSVAIPTRFDDDPKFLTYSQLRRAYENPDLLSPVRDRIIKLARHLSLRQIEWKGRDSLQKTGRMEFFIPDGPTYVIHARDMLWVEEEDGWRFEPFEGDDFVEIVRNDSDGTVRQRASSMFISSPWTRSGQIVQIGEEDIDQRVDFDLMLTDLRTVTDAGEIGQHPQREIRRLQSADDPRHELVAMSSSEILELARPYLDRPLPDEFVAIPARELSRRIEKLRREIVGKQHERMAMSVACFVMVMAGAVTAMRLGNSQPLSVYLWSFLPSLLTVLTVSAGQPMVESSGRVGLVLLWGGVAAFGAYTLVAFVSLRSR